MARYAFPRERPRLSADLMDAPHQAAARAVECIPIESGAVDMHALDWRPLGGQSSLAERLHDWLALLCGSLQHATAAMVMLAEEGSDESTPVAVWPDPSRDLSHLLPGLQAATHARRGIIEAIPGVGDSVTACSVVAAPIQVFGEVRGGVVIETDATLDGVLHSMMRQLYWALGRVEALIVEAEARPLRARIRRLQAVLESAAASIENPGKRSSARALATVLAHEFGCERVSVGEIRSGSCRVLAISNLADLVKEQSLSRQIAAAMDESVDQGSTLVFPEGGHAAPTVLMAHRQLTRMAGNEAICTMPLYDGDRPIGALVLERSEVEPFGRDDVVVLEGVAALAGPLLLLQERHEWGLWQHLMHAGQQISTRLFGREHFTFKLVAGSVFALCAVLAVVPVRFSIGAVARVEGEIQRAVIAPFDGYVSTARVKAGEIVDKSELIAEMDATDLQLEAGRWRAKVQENRQSLRQALAERDRAAAAIVQAQLEQAQAQLDLAEQNRNRASLVAPIAGVVLMGDLRDRLGSPVKRGEVLFEIAPLDSYRVRIDIDERDMEYVRVGQDGTLALTAIPGRRVPIRLTAVTSVAEVRDGRNAFVAEAVILSQGERFHPGLEGYARLHAGWRPVGWILARRAVDWVRLALWRWLP